MGWQAVFTMKLEPELRDAFMAAAKRADRPASQLMRELMRDFVESHEEPDEAYWDLCVGERGAPSRQAGTSQMKKSRPRWTHYLLALSASVEMPHEVALDARSQADLWRIF
jgi:hypothetical protein